MEQEETPERFDLPFLSDYYCYPAHRNRLGEVVIEKIGRNDPCPCGSGKKLKKCHREFNAERYRQTILAINSELNKIE